jgi:hypothetical protein
VIASRFGFRSSIVLVSILAVSGCLPPPPASDLAVKISTSTASVPREGTYEVDVTVTNGTLNKPGIDVPAADMIISFPIFVPNPLQSREWPIEFTKHDCGPDPANPFGSRELCVIGPINSARIYVIKMTYANVNKGHPENTSAGPLTHLVVIDPDNKVSDSDRSNNTASVTVVHQ